MSSPYTSFFRTLGLALLLLLFLLGYEALHWKMGWTNWKRPHFFSPYDSLLPSQSLDNQAFELEDLEKVLQEWQTPKADSLAMLGPSDSLAGKPSSDSVLPPPLPVMPVGYEGKEHLASFFEALRALQRGQRQKVRIAYFGDSTTEGDITVADLRDALQRVLGGQGVGFVPIKSHGMRGRRSIQQSCSENWVWKKYFRNEKNVTEFFGISGDYFLPQWQPGDTVSALHWLEFRAASSKRYPNCDSLAEVYLFFGLSTDSSQAQARAELRVVRADSQAQVFELRPQPGLNKLQINNLKTKTLALNFKFKGRFPLYGLLFEGSQGVYVDNLAKRSDSGSHLHKIPGWMLRAFQAQVPYDLVILHYGPNVLRSDLRQYGHYRELLKRNMQHLQAHWPGVPILLVGHPDRAFKDEQGLRSDPALPSLILAQRQAAYACNAAFFDLFAAMGGKGTMIEWVERSLASPDYIHFSHGGGKLVAEMLLKYWAWPGLLENKKSPNL